MNWQALVASEHIAPRLLQVAVVQVFHDVRPLLFWVSL